MPKTYTVENAFLPFFSAKSKFQIDPNTSELRILRPIDRETLGTVDARSNIENITGIQPLRVTCTVTSGNVTFTPQRRTINVTIMDVNDSPPVFPNYRNVQYLEKNVEISDDMEVVQVIVMPPRGPNTCV